MNVRLVAGAAIMAFVFGGWFVGFALDEGWLTATISTLALGGGAALVAAGAILFMDGWERR